MWYSTECIVLHKNGHSNGIAEHASFIFILLLVFTIFIFFCLLHSPQDNSPLLCNCSIRNAHIEIKKIQLLISLCFIRSACSFYQQHKHRIWKVYALNAKQFVIVHISSSLIHSTEFEIFIFYDVHVCV